MMLSIFDQLGFIFNQSYAAKKLGSVRFAKNVWAKKSAKQCFEANFQFFIQKGDLPTYDLPKRRNDRQY